MARTGPSDRARDEASATPQAASGGVCPAEEALAAFSDKWKIRIILSIAAGAPGRFLALRRALGNVHQYSLTRSLRELEGAGIVARVPSVLGSGRTDYVLTEKGLTLVPILLKLDEWQSGEELTTDVARLRRAYA